MSPLRQAMNQLGLTIPVLSRCLGCSQSVVTKWIAGDLPSVEHNKDIIALIGLDLRMANRQWKNQTLIASRELIEKSLTMSNRIQ